MIGTGKNHGLRIESVSWHGHQVVVTYNTECRHIWVESNGSAKLLLKESPRGTMTVYDGKGVNRLGEIFTDFDSLDIRFAFAYLTEKDFNE